MIAKDCCELSICRRVIFVNQQHTALPRYDIHQIQNKYKEPTTIPFHIDHFFFSRVFFLGSGKTEMSRYELVLQ